MWRSCVVVGTSLQCMELFLMNLISICRRQKIVKKPRSSSSCCRSHTLQAAAMVTSAEGVAIPSPPSPSLNSVEAACDDWDNNNNSNMVSFNPVEIMSNIAAAAAATTMNLDIEIDEIPAPAAEDDNNLDIFQTTTTTTTTTRDDADQTQQQQLCPSSTGQKSEEQSLIITTTGDEDECIRSSPSWATIITKECQSLQFFNLLYVQSR